LYSSSNIKVIRLGKMRRARERYEMRTKFSSKNLVGKRLFGRPRSRWEGNIEMDHRGIGWEGVDRMHLA